jgi:hypothetical protein
MEVDMVTLVMVLLLALVSIIVLLGVGVVLARYFGGYYIIWTKQNECTWCGEHHKLLNHSCIMAWAYWANPRNLGRVDVEYYIGRPMTELEFYVFHKEDMRLEDEWIAYCKEQDQKELILRNGGEEAIIAWHNRPEGGTLRAVSPELDDWRWQYDYATKPVSDNPVRDEKEHHIRELKQEIRCEAQEYRVNHPLLMSLNWYSSFLD